MTDLLIDTATTGMWRWGEPHDDPDQPHLIRLAWSKAGHIQCLLVRPRDDWEMQADAQDKHKISLEECALSGWDLRRVLAQLVASMGDVDRVVAYNWDFHRRIIDRAIAEAQLPAIDWPDPACAMRKSTPIVKKPARGRNGYVNPKFGEAYMYFTSGEEMRDSSDPIARGEIMVDALATIWRGIEAER